MRRGLLIAAGALFVLWTAATALTFVQPGELAVVRRFGRILPGTAPPGLHVGWPWGIDRVDRVPVGNVRRVIVGSLDESDEAPSGQLLTGDHNLVNVQAEIDYVVVADEVDRFVLQADRADVLVARAAESVLAEWIAGRTVDEALLRGKAILPAVLVAQINRRLEPYHLGVRVEQASLTKLNPPAEVRQAFEDVARAHTRIDTQIQQAEQSSAQKRSAAEAERYRLQQLASAYARETTLQGAAEARTFLERLQQYREISKTQPDYLNVLWQDEVTRLFAKLKDAGRLDLLDHHLGADGINITQFPLRKK